MPGKGKKKYYAVRAGHKTGLYNEWSEAEKQVMGYKGAEYSSFRLKRDAEKYLKRRKSQRTVKETIKQINMTWKISAMMKMLTITLRMKYRRS